MAWGGERKKKDKRVGIGLFEMIVSGWMIFIE